MEVREFYLLKRRQLGIKITDIAEFLGVNASTISRFETGKIVMSKAKDYMQYIDNKASQK